METLDRESPSPSPSPIRMSSKEQLQGQPRNVLVNCSSTASNRTSVVPRFSSPLHFLQESIDFSDPLHTNLFGLDPKPLRAIPAGQMSDHCILPVTCSESGIETFVSQSHIKHENTRLETYPVAKWLNNFSTHDTLIFRPDLENTDAEAAMNFSIALCASKGHEFRGDSLAPVLQVGYPKPSSEFEPRNMARDGGNGTQTQNQVCAQKMSDEDSQEAGELYSQKIIPLRQDSARNMSDRLRRAKISKGVEELKNSLPCSDKPWPTWSSLIMPNLFAPVTQLAHAKVERGKEAVLDDVIDHIKFLKLQLKVLTQSRLCGEATPYPFVHLEGYGHYLFQYQMCNEPLEELMGQLMGTNMQATNELLESKGLTILPMDLAYKLVA